MKLSIFVAMAMVASSASAQVRIIQTNSMGDNIHLIDPKTNDSRRDEGRADQPRRGGVA